MSLVGFGIYLVYLRKTANIKCNTEFYLTSTKHFLRYIISYHCKGNLFLNSNHGTFQSTRLDSLLLIKHESLHVTFVLDTCIK